MIKFLCTLPLLSLTIHLLLVFSAAFAVSVSVLTVQVISFCCLHLIILFVAQQLYCCCSVICFARLEDFILLLKSLFSLCSNSVVAIQVFVLTFQQFFLQFNGFWLLSVLAV